MMHRWCIPQGVHYDHGLCLPSEIVFQALPWIPEFYVLQNGCFWHRVAFVGMCQRCVGIVRLTKGPNLLINSIKRSLSAELINGINQPIDAIN